MKLIPITKNAGESMCNIIIWLLEGGDKIFLVPTLNGFLYNGTTRESVGASDEILIQNAVNLVQEDSKVSPKPVIFYGHANDKETALEIERFFHTMMIIRLNTQLRYADAQAYEKLCGRV